jgi:hypothetical protein
MDEKKPDQGFTVTDRRRFTDAGDVRPDADPAPGAPPAEPPADTGAAKPSARTPGVSSEEPPVSFASFVLGLSTQALIALGEVVHPVSQQVEQDLVGARHLIDVLGILRDKTRNNLTRDEAGLLESALYDLRLRYVALARGQQASAPAESGAPSPQVKEAK